TASRRGFGGRANWIPRAWRMNHVRPTKADTDRKTIRMPVTPSAACKKSKPAEPSAPMTLPLIHVFVRTPLALEAIEEAVDGFPGTVGSSDCGKAGKLAGDGGVSGGAVTGRRTFTPRQRGQMNCRR